MECGCGELGLIGCRCCEIGRASIQLRLASHVGDILTTWAITPPTCATPASYHRQAIRNGSSPLVCPHG